MTSHGARLTSCTAFVWHEQARDAPGAYQGLIDTDAIPLHPDADVDLCGPVPFIQVVRAGLHRRGTSDE
jgi:nitric oxide dioxygenase